MRVDDEAAQRIMRFMLAHAVQIDTRRNVFLSAIEPALRLGFERNKRLQNWLWRDRLCCSRRRAGWLYLRCFRRFFSSGVSSATAGAAVTILRGAGFMRFTLLVTCDQSSSSSARAGVVSSRLDPISFRQEHEHACAMSDVSREPAGACSRAEEYICPGRAENGRSRVLRNHQPLE